MIARSYLFVPADRPERFAKALAAGADVVIIDLEDAVAPASKSAARDALSNWLASRPDAAEQAGVQVLVRINGADTPWFHDDVLLASDHAVTAVMLPKAAEIEPLREVVTRTHARRVLPLVETAGGIAAARKLARQPGVFRLVFGTVDFQLDLDIEGDGDELLAARSELVLASRLAGIVPPADGVETAIDDIDALAAATRRARRLGFGAKLCIHPRQVATVNAGFSPSAEQLAWAQRVVDAAAGAGGAAVAVDGKMVDAPVLARARRMLAARR
ncbi:MAG: CoA ester lyase [Burkholderiaceae bacterium]|jgi:citrate lyase subunit beta/citryl-CoA lyase|nr:CoA ester lyase [Burkholderiaceae bacterium]MEB2317129.1 CoA ester lyase [Pseudomonadota bacterium]